MKRALFPHLFKPTYSAIKQLMVCYWSDCLGQQSETIIS
jgi:hypothetical protein